MRLLLRRNEEMTVFDQHTAFPNLAESKIGSSDAVD
jgi:hypothetical protein